MNSSVATIPEHQAIVFFDGVCGLCSHTVDFLMARDHNRRLRYAPLQGSTASQVVPESVREQLSTLVYAENGHLYYRSSAVVRILQRIGGRWAALSVMLWLIPRPLRDLGYRFVSRLRYRIFGRHESCRLPTPEERELFLD